VATKTDAKGQVIKYTYDALARLYLVQRYPTELLGAEDTCQQERYYYDGTSPVNNGYAQNSAGRLSAVQYCAAATGEYPTGGYATTFVEQYSYNPGGAKINKGLLVTRTLRGPSGLSPYTADLESVYTYDGEGQMLTVQYPGSTGGSAGPHLGYQYDTMGRLNTMTDLATSASLISGATHDPASRLTQITGSVYQETRSYNVMGQLTLLTNNMGSMSYQYSDKYNNGKITGASDISGEQGNIPMTR
jgi:hypothetical protein